MIEVQKSNGPTKVKLIIPQLKLTNLAQSGSQEVITR